MLPWVPLMAGGGTAAVIERWNRLAAAEPDPRARANYAVLALTFATKTKWRTTWEQALEGWNVTESTILDEFRTKGRAEGRAEGELRTAAAAVVAALEARLGAVPPDLAAAVRATTDPDRLLGWVTVAVTAPTLDDFRQTTGL